MRILIVVLTALLCLSLKSQDIIYQITPSTKNAVIPQFKGGEFAMYDFLTDNIKYPQEAMESGIHGRIFVSFVVEKDGSVSNVKLLIGIGGGCDEEAIRVVKMMNGLWIPGTIDGEPVRVQFNLPVKFTISESTNSHDAASSYNKGLKLMKEAKYDKAISYFSAYKPAENLYPDAIYARGMCKYLLADYKGSITDWEDAKKAGHEDCGPKLSEVYFKLGNIYREEKKYPIAISCFSKSLENSPDDVNVLYNRGISWFYLGEKEKACEDWQKILDLGSYDSQAFIEEYCK
jgi:TonB family protein